MTKDQLFAKHKEWIQIVKTFGCDDYAEDIVQEMYFRMLKFEPKQITKTYVWITLRNCYLLQFKNRIETVPIDLRKHQITDEYNDQFEAIENEIQSWDYFHKEMFELYLKKSAREISRETKIGLRTVCETINKCKTKIQQKWQEENR